MKREDVTREDVATVVEICRLLGGRNKYRTMIASLSVAVTTARQIGTPKLALQKLLIQLWDAAASRENKKKDVN